LVETIINSGATGVVQIEIESKFVEITQNNLKELSFDWLLGAFNVGKSGNFAAGGTSGTSPSLNPADFPIVAPGGVPVGQNPVTAGLRSGVNAISQNAIDALLFGISGNSFAAPGIAALDGRSMVEVAVHDRGVGIPRDRLSRIWEPYFTHKPGGTGLRLAIVRQTLLAHDGAVSAESTAGTGTTIRLFLPVEAPGAAG